MEPCCTSWHAPPWCCGTKRRRSLVTGEPGYPLARTLMLISIGPRTTILRDKVDKGQGCIAERAMPSLSERHEHLINGGDDHVR